MRRATNTMPCAVVPPNHAADPRLWYVSDRRIRTETAGLKAACIAASLATGLETEPDEQALFAALHTCAFRAGRRTQVHPFTSSERTLWSRRWHSIRDHIAQKNLGLVHMISRRYRLGTLDEDDLFSEAMYSLGRAIDRFNPWKGFRFSTYACNVMTRGLSRRRKGEARYRSLFPVQHDASYDKPAAAADFREELYLERLRRALQCNLGGLAETETTILAHRFCADGEPNRTFEEIGRLVGLSKERVRQIQNAALRKLREVLELDPVLQ